MSMKMKHHLSNVARSFEFEVDDMMRALQIYEVGQHMSNESAHSMVVRPRQNPTSRPRPKPPQTTSNRT